jgi:hypothetical protein
VGVNKKNGCYTAIPPLPEAEDAIFDTQKTAPSLKNGESCLFYLLLESGRDYHLCLFVWGGQFLCCIPVLAC